MTEQERFEQYKAASCGTSYADFKAMADNNEKLFGCRYPEGSRNDEDWQLWQAAIAQAVPEGYVLINKECSDDMAEAIAFEAGVCGGIAGDIYSRVIETAMIAATQENE